MYNDIAQLIEKVKTNQVDEYGDAVYTDTKTEVFVKVKSVTRSEFYTGHAAGYDPQIVFELADYWEYSGQELIEYDGTIYKIIRTYRIGIPLELVCAHVDGET